MKVFNFWFWRKKFIPPPIEFPTGCKKEPFMKEDYKIEEVLKAFPVFDWNKGYDVEEDMGQKIVVKDQGRSGSCVFQAWGYYAGVLEAFEIGKYIDFNARKGYSKYHLPDGGAYVRDGGQWLTNDGIVPSVLFPDKKTEQEMRDSSDWRKDLDAVAKVYLKSSYLRIPKNNIDHLASVIQMNKGVITGVLDDFDPSWKTAFPKVGGTISGGHCIYFCKAKLINGIKYCGIPNSWGEDVGDKGWQWFGEEWINSNRFFDPRTIMDLPSEVVREIEKPKYRFNKDLKWGMKDKDIKILQRCLAFEECFLFPEFTDYFGGYTLRAAKCFQAKYGIEPIAGYIGPKTRQKLNEIFS